MTRKTIILTFAILLLLPLGTRINAQSSKKDYSRYLEGAVPEVDGKVVFSKEFKVSGKSKQQLFDILYTWMEERLAENNNEESRIVYSDFDEGIIAGKGQEWIVFSSSFISLDRTLINYQLTAVCEGDERCVVKIEKIRFIYEDKNKYTAEEWVTDKFTLNKAKTKIMKGAVKWRTKTVDFSDDIFTDVAVAFGMQDPRYKESKRQESLQTAPPVVAKEGPIVIGEDGTVAGQREEELKGVASTQMPGYLEIDLKRIPGEIYSLMGNSKIVITTEDGKVNLTTQEGGAIGYQASKAVAYCTLGADQPYTDMEETETYTLNLYTEDNDTPAAIIQCSKISSQATKHRNPTHTYVGEITKLLIKE